MPWRPQSGPQLIALSADFVDELFYGGERGGGKSDFLLGYQEDAAMRYEGKSRGILIRQTYKDLEELQARAMEIFPGYGAVYHVQPTARHPLSNAWYWPNGATLKMRYLEQVRDYARYHGHQYSHVAIDEVPQYPTPEPVLMMMSTLRSAHGVPCGIRLTGNPGDIGHQWVKARYVDMGPPMKPWLDPDTRFSRVFIPAKLSDNHELTLSNPRYRDALMAATEGNEALRSAWLYGVWDIPVGAFFGEAWSRSKHVIGTIKIPEHWLRFRSFDWGGQKPFSVGWYAVSDGTSHHINAPAGAIIKYREWYGVKQDKFGIKPNVGLNLKNTDIAKGIIARTNGENIAYSVADPSVFKSEGGPSIAEQFLNSGVAFHKADNTRVTGWKQIMDRLIGDDGRPMLYIMDSCIHTIRTISMVPRDRHKLDDINTESEDHAADELRYACMSRPYVRVTEARIEKPKYGTFDYMYADQPTSKSPYRL